MTLLTLILLLLAAYIVYSLANAYIRMADELRAIRRQCASKSAQAT